LAAWQNIFCIELFYFGVPLCECSQPPPPDASIYSKDDVVLEVENTLICHVTGLFPPPVNISWTKNNQIVTEGTSLSQYRINNDEGDIYSCTVFHKALDSRLETKTWGEADMTHLTLFRR
uniref:Major histocompatibility complex class II integral membrane alpha chain gene n=1 Tax=Sinocyclocheilus grahami TaxID=75366 RepID=A0A672TGP8_SINGR